MNDEFRDPPQTKKELFWFYNFLVKPLYTEIEARNNCLPAELLFEIFSAFDHLKRCYIDGLPEKEAVNSAYSHLKRGALDAFKLKLKYYNTDYELFQQDARLVPLIDNGDFMRAVQRNRKTISQLGKQARQEESKQDTNQAFNTWVETSLLIDAFYDQFFGSEKLIWAKIFEKKVLWKERLKGVIGALIIGLAVACIAHLIGW